MVSKVMSDEFGWLFKRNHQEHDFGIDGQVELVTEGGYVTGQMVAVQIKCGQSFFSSTNDWGYVYRGEEKHLSYLVNYPIPVLICICNPDTSECYWTRFLPEATESTGSGWKITVPFDNKLSESKGPIRDMVGPVRNGLAEMEAYWKQNSLISNSSIIFYALDTHDVITHELELPRKFFDRMRLTKELASKCQSKVEIMIAGYDDDPRELYEIPEVREYISKLDAVLSDLFFFARSEQPTHTLALFAMCQTTVSLQGAQPADGLTKRIEFDIPPVAGFIQRHCPALNELTEWIGMPPEEEKRLFYDVVKCVGLELPSNADEA